MLMNLVKIRMIAMFSGMFTGSKKKKKSLGKTILFAILAIYIVGCFGVLFGGLFFSIAEPFGMLGMDWLYFGFMGVMVFLLCFVGSVFVTQNQLFDAKDNDLIMSMAVPPSSILASRLVALLGLNYIYELLIAVPGGVVFCITRPITVTGIIIFVVSFLLLPFMVVAVSALFGWIIALVNSKMRNKNVVVMVFTLVLFMGYMYVCMRLQHYIEILVRSGEEIGAAIKTALPPFYYLGTAIADSNFGAFLIFILCCIVPFAIVYWVLSKTFIKIATTNRGQVKIKYKEQSMKVSGMRKALIIKEARHFLGNPMYMFNAGIGLVFMPIGAIFLLIKSDYIMEMVKMMGFGSEFLGPIICVAFCSMCAMTIISAPTISIEGKTLWISQAAPIRERDVLLAKSDMHILMSLPSIIISAIICLIALKISLLSMIMIFALPIMFTVFNALFGVAINLKYPKFDWINETVAVKQGMAPMLAMFVSMATILIPVVLYIFVFADFMTPEIYLIVAFLFFAALAFGTYWYLVNKGIAVFRQLQN
ncbi:MAG: hypothetical protein RR769_03945 [Anaerovoracaceae bacterium]